MILAFRGAASSLRIRQDQDRSRLDKWASDQGLDVLYIGLRGPRFVAAMSHCRTYNLVFGDFARPDQGRRARARFDRLFNWREWRMDVRWDAPWERLPDRPPEMEGTRMGKVTSDAGLWDREIDG